MKNIQGNRLLSDQELYMCKLHEIVERSIEEQNLLMQNLENPPLESSTVGQRISDKVARFGGSWKFIISFGVFIALWIAANTVLWHTRNSPDPYPFILLNLLLSCIAALQAPVIMMSQHRQESRDREHAEQDYRVNLKAELEIRHLHEKMDHLMQHHMLRLMEIQQVQGELLRELGERLPPRP